jgi:glycine cleavage system transcriptional repressor
MQTDFVLALTGPDRIGIVDELTGLLLRRGGNVATSRMARLGGEFAVLMLVAMPADRFPGLEDDLEGLAAQGYTFTITGTRADGGGAGPRPGWTAYRIEVEGADHEGIIHEVAHFLSERGVNIEAMDSECLPGATSGVPLFSMTAEVVAPPGLDAAGLRAGLDAIGRRKNLDIRAVAADAP